MIVTFVVYLYRFIDDMKQVRDNRKHDGTMIDLTRHDDLLHDMNNRTNETRCIIVLTSIRRAKALVTDDIKCDDQRIILRDTIIECNTALQCLVFVVFFYS
jgi:hypothetical protein